jgi:hypothetical protein
MLSCNDPRQTAHADVSKFASSAAHERQGEAKLTEAHILTAIECAAYRRCSVRKLDRERADGRGPPYVRIDGRIFYRRADVDNFISARVHGGDPGDAGNTVEPQTCQRSQRTQVQHDHFGVANKGGDS